MTFSEWLVRQVGRHDGVGKLACLAKVHCEEEFTLSQLCVMVVRVQGNVFFGDPWAWVQSAVEEFTGKDFECDEEED